MTEHDEIIVGVDGGEGGRAAIRYATEEAKRRGTGIRIVHVMPVFPPTATYPVAYVLTSAESRQMGSTILAEARKAAAAELGGQRVTTTLLTGTPVPSLVQTSASAGLIVLGDEPRPALERLATGSILTGVAAHAPVPVVAVPTSWTPAARRRRVVVGVNDCDDSAGLVRRAVDAATERDVELVVLHAWELPTLYDDLTLSHVEVRNWEDTSRRAIQHVIDQVSRSTLTVHPRIEIRHGQPARVLVDSTDSADLLVIGRRRRAFPGGHLGSTGRAVLRNSRCPVEVLPPIAVQADDLLLEHDGVFEKAAGERSEAHSDSRTAVVTPETR